jgi:hypothetical protein
MTMSEEIEAVFDKIEEWHREFQLRFSQPFFYSLTKKLPQISRSSRNHCTCRHSPRTTHRRSSKKLPPINRSSRNYCTCRQSATHRRSTHSAAPMDFAPHHNHLLIPVPHLPLWLSNCKKKTMCFLHLARKKKMTTILDTTFTISDTTPVLHGRANVRFIIMGQDMGGSY